MPAESPRGRFIVIEGGDGVGKTTQVAALAAALESRGVSVVSTREPGGTALGEKVRDLLAGGDPADPRTEALLIAAARAEHCAAVIRPALERGAWVVSDRFSGSFFAYQGFGRGLSFSDLESLNGFASGGTEPDLTVLLVNQSAGAHRGLDGADRFEGMGADFQARVEAGFITLAERWSWEVVDSRGSRGEVTSRVLDAIEARLDLP